MANTSTNPSGPEPLVSYVSPVVFWMVSALLALAIVGVYVLVKKDVANAQAQFQADMLTQMSTQDDKTNKAIGVSAQQLNTELAKLQETNTKLEVALRTTSAELAELNKRNETFLKSKFPDFEKSVNDTLAAKADASDLKTTNNVVYKVETGLKYLTDRVATIEGTMGRIDKEVKELASSGNEMHAEFKREHEALQKEVVDTKKSGTATQEQLLKLEAKATDFQLRVMHERSQQALKALRNRDLQAVLNFVDIKKNVDIPKN